MDRAPFFPKSLIRRALSGPLLLGSLAALLAGCPHTNRPTELRAVDPSDEPSMNAGLLGPGRLVVEVDWVEGEAPLDAALDALRDWLARKTAHPPSQMEVRRGREVARAPGKDLRAIVDTTLVNAHPEDGAYFVYVLYWGRFARYRGVTFPSFQLDERIRFPVVVMCLPSIEHDSWLWLTRRKVESAVLVHEFGHVAGLVTSGRRVHDGHCPDTRCRMYHGPDWPAIRANCFPVLCEGKLPLTFCDVCEKELADGRAKAIAAAAAKAAAPAAPPAPSVPGR